MEDKRVKKTKKLLKNTLVELLEEQPFEQISVTNLCSKADVSRITFYTHYNDKYDLLEDYFQDMIVVALKDYAEMESRENRGGDMVIGFSHVLECIVNLFINHIDFFKHASPDKNPYIAFTFYNHVLSQVENHTVKESYKHVMKYSARQITGFLCYGLLGFISESKTENIPMEKVNSSAKQLLTDILRSSILFQI